MSIKSYWSACAFGVQIRRRSEQACRAHHPQQEAGLDCGHDGPFVVVVKREAIAASVALMISFTIASRARLDEQTADVSERATTRPPWPVIAISLW
jgi:hypothetical protein